MSILAMAWAMRVRCGNPARKLVLMTLADYADDSGRAWPSQATIAAHTEMGERTIRRALAELEAAGLITRTARFRGNGSASTDIVILSMGAGEAATGQGELKLKRGANNPKPHTGQSGRYESPIPANLAAPYRPIWPPQNHQVEPSKETLAKPEKAAKPGNAREKENPLNGNESIEGATAALAQARREALAKIPEGEAPGAERPIPLPPAIARGLKLATAKVQQSGGSPEIAEADFPPALKSALEFRAEQIERATQACPEPHATAMVSELLLVCAAKDQGAEQARVLLRHIVKASAGYPLWAIAAACAKWRETQRFRPTPADLCALLRADMADLNSEAAALRRLFAATVIPTRKPRKAPQAAPALRPDRENGLAATTPAGNA